MLDLFLVLGQIPGTNFQITFNELLVCFAVATVVWISLRAFGKIRRNLWRAYYVYLDVFARLRQAVRFNPLAR